MREKETHCRVSKSTIKQKRGEGGEGGERDKGHTQMNKSKKMSKENLMEKEKIGFW